MIFKSKEEQELWKESLLINIGSIGCNSKNIAVEWSDYFVNQLRVRVPEKQYLTFECNKKVPPLEQQVLTEI